MVGVVEFEIVEFGLIVVVVAVAGRDVEKLNWEMYQHESVFRDWKKEKSLLKNELLV